jgi:hypothetical protein
LTNPFPNEDDVIEQLTLNRAEWINHMVGGQVGIRWSERKSRWLLSSELRAFAAQNFQDFIGQTDTLQTLYDGVGTGTEVVAEKYERQTTRGNDENFVYGFDVRAESAFELTRDVSLTMGAQFMHFRPGRRPRLDTLLQLRRPDDGGFHLRCASESVSRTPTCCGLVMG